MNLLELSKQANRPKSGQTIIIHGAPTTGKTSLAATIARVPDITEVTYFGCENGDEALFTAIREKRLDDIAAAKIKMIRIEDTPQKPYAYETVFKCLGVMKEQKICVEHGRVDCPICTKDKKEFQTYDITKQDKTKATIIDTGSHVADSFMNYLCRDKADDYKPGWDEFGPQGRKMTEILTLIEAGKTNWVYVTQSIGVNIVPGTTDLLATADNKNNVVEQTYPLTGSQAFSMKVAKHFGQKVYMDIRLGKPAAGSSIGYRANTVVGSRTGWKIQDHKDDLSLHWLWEDMKAKG